MPSRTSRALRRRALAFACAAVALVPLPARAAPSSSIDGIVVDAQTGLPLAGARVAAPERGLAAVTGERGTFQLTVEPGVYRLRVVRDAYASADSDDVVVAEHATVRVTLALRRASTSSGLATIGRTATRADRALQTSSTISRAVDAEALARGGEFRAVDALRRLPGVVNGLTGDTASLSDDVNLSLRGIGALETVATLDGHPVALGFPGGYNYQLSPLSAIREVVVTYGSGSDLSGIDAIGGSVDLRTLEPTLDQRARFGQTFGTWNHLGSRLQATGTVDKLSYAFATGVSSIDGPLRGMTMYETGASFDPSAAAFAPQATYVVDAQATTRDGLAKLRYAFSPGARLAYTGYVANIWEDKSGNGDIDYLAPQQAGALGAAFLAAKKSSDPCPAGAFTVANAYNAKLTWGQNRDGSPDGGAACQTPASYAAAASGWYGAGPSYQIGRLTDHRVRFDGTAGAHALHVDASTTWYAVNQSRIGRLPYKLVPGDRDSFSDTTEVSTGVDVGDDLIGPNNAFSAGYAYLDRAFALVKTGVLTGAPNVADRGFYLRDVWRPQGSPLTLALATSLRASSATSTSSFDPRLSAIYRLSPRDVVRVSAGATTTQPSADQLGQIFSGTKPPAGGGQVNCGGLNAVGTAPSALLRPERGVDREIAAGHVWRGDSLTEISLYDTSVFSKLYRTIVPLAQSGSGFVDAATLAGWRAAVGASCPGVANADALLGVSGMVNVGRLRARGMTIDGRLRFDRRLFLDYDWGLTSTTLADAPPALLASDPTLILGTQLPRLPLHTLSLALDARAGALGVRLGYDAVSAGNTKALPAYATASLRLDGPVPGGTLTLGISNLFDQFADVRGLRYAGVPLPVSVAPGGPTGAAATERFGLPPRALTLDYAVRLK